MCYLLSQSFAVSVFSESSPVVKKIRLFEDYIRRSKTFPSSVSLTVYVLHLSQTLAIYSLVHINKVINYSFIHSGYSVGLQVHYYSEALPTIALILCRS